MEQNGLAQQAFGIAFVQAIRRGKLLNPLFGIYKAFGLYGELFVCRICEKETIFDLITVIHSHEKNVTCHSTRLPNSIASGVLSQRFVYRK